MGNAGRDFFSAGSLVFLFFKFSYSYYDIIVFTFFQVFQWNVSLQSWRAYCNKCVKPTFIVHVSLWDWKKKNECDKLVLLPTVNHRYIQQLIIDSVTQKILKSVKSCDATKKKEIKEWWINSICKIHRSHIFKL